MTDTSTLRRASSRSRNVPPALMTGEIKSDSELELEISEKQKQSHVSFEDYRQLDSSETGGISKSGQSSTISLNQLLFPTDSLTMSDHKEEVLQKNPQFSSDELNKEQSLSDRQNLLRGLSEFTSNEHDKERQITASRFEQLKRIINPVEMRRSVLAKTYMELQDRLKVVDQNNNFNSEEQDRSYNFAASDKDSAQELLTKKKQDDSRERECLNILNTLLELLDRHPLLALPRDSIYFLDYNCNELSTQSYLNLKVQNLDNLINQHRRYRYYMNERLRRSERMCLLMAREFELEKKSRAEAERRSYKDGIKIHLKHLDQLKAELEKEKSDKQTIVMTLLNELLDERETTQLLSKELEKREIDSKNSLAKNAQNENLIKLQSDLSNLSLQLKKQSVVFSQEKSQLQCKIEELEKENAILKNRLDQQSFPVVSEVREAHQDLAITQSPKLNSNAPKLSATFSKQSNVNSATSAGPVRKDVGPPNLRSPVSKTPQTVIQNFAAPSKVSPSIVASNITTNGRGPIVAPRPPSHSSGTTQKNPVPLARNTPVNKSSDTTYTENAVMIQNFLKLGSKSSTIQRNSKTHSASVSVANKNTTGSQSIVKPVVPAKPAQLMDQQRNSIN